MRLSVALFATLCISTAPAYAAPVNIVALGASNSNGKGVAIGEAFPARIEAMLRARGVDASVTVDAVDGRDTATILSSIDSIPDGTALVLLEPNRSNDRNHGLSTEANDANLRRITASLARRGIRTILLNTPRLPPDDFQSGGVHLTAQGHQDVAAYFVPRILSIIRDRRSSKHVARPS